MTNESALRLAEEAKRLIGVLANVSFYCGQWDDDADDDAQPPYEELARAANAAHADLSAAIDRLAALAHQEQRAEPEWMSMADAPRDQAILAVVDGIVRTVRWGKTSHIPMYGFCLADQGPEDFDMCEPRCWTYMPQPPKD